jgi:chromate reductase, NAD(P)H dehydrogenase (quinone)
MEHRAPRIIAFAGSLRANSNNKKLARNMASGAEEAGAQVRVLDLSDYPLPVYDADIYDSVNGDPHALFDAGGRIGAPHDVPMPEGLLRLKEHFRWADGWIVATPEYNRSIPGMLKNMVDWLTRLAPGESPLDNFTYKVVGCASAAYEGNGHGAVSDLGRLLTGLECIMIPGGDVFYISDDLFDAEGRLQDASQRLAAARIGRRVARMVERFLGTGATASTEPRARGAS